METRMVQISAAKDRKIKIGMIPGHFVTTHSHVNAYVDLTEIKCESNTAQRAAEILARAYNHALPIETIVCMEGTELVGAYLAQEISRPGTRALTSGQSIAVIAPEYDSNRQMIFRDNVQKKLWNKHVILLIASITTGKTINRALECLSYYGGVPVGIASLFSAVKEINGFEINTILSSDDIPDYQSYSNAECPFCREKRKIDAIVNSFGYSKL